MGPGKGSLASVRSDVAPEKGEIQKNLDRLLKQLPGCARPGPGRPFLLRGDRRGGPRGLSSNSGDTQSQRSSVRMFGGRECEGRQMRDRQGSVVLDQPKYLYESIKENFQADFQEPMRSSNPPGAKHLETLLRVNCWCLACSFLWQRRTQELPSARVTAMDASRFELSFYLGLPARLTDLFFANRSGQSSRAQAKLGNVSTRGCLRILSCQTGRTFTNRTLSGRSWLTSLSTTRCSLELLPGLDI